MRVMKTTDEEKTLNFVVLIIFVQVACFMECNMCSKLLISFIRRLVAISYEYRMWLIFTDDLFLKIGYLVLMFCLEDIRIFNK